MEQLNKLPNILNSKKIFVIQDIECVAMSAEKGSPPVRFIIGQEVSLIIQDKDVINFSYGGEYFSAPSYYFVTDIHWKDITNSVIKERARKKSIRKSKRTPENERIRFKAKQKNKLY